MEVYLISVSFQKQIFTLILLLLVPAFQTALEYIWLRTHITTDLRRSHSTETGWRKVHRGVSALSSGIIRWAYRCLRNARSGSVRRLDRSSHSATHTLSCHPILTHRQHACANWAPRLLRLANEEPPPPPPTKLSTITCHLTAMQPPYLSKRPTPFNIIGLSVLTSQ